MRLPSSSGAQDPQRENIWQADEDAGGGEDNESTGKNIWGTDGRATDHFVAKSYRTNQREAIEAIEKGFEDGYRFVILEAPTGSGKSHIARALSFESGDAYILTVQKILQDQYAKDFSDMFIMKGRGAYRCVLDPDDSCATGICRRSKMLACEDCPYRVAKQQSIEAMVTVHNFDSFYYQNAFGGGYPGRRLIVVDEAHNCEQKYLDFMSFSIKETDDIQIPVYETIEEYDRFLKERLRLLTLEVVSLNEVKEDSSEGLSVEDLERLEEMTQLVNKLKYYFRTKEKAGVDNEYVFEIETKKGIKYLTFRPLFVGNYVHETLFQYGDRILLMSATIINKGIFCKELGIKPEAALFIKLDSTFPAANRPIVRKYAGSMSLKKIEANLPKLVVLIEEILDKHPTRKGIIQTHSEKIATYIQEHVKDDRLTFNKDFKSAKEAIAAHVAKPNSFLVASGLREGVDLYDDLSRVQIICKIPYPNLGDKRVRRKTELNPEWLQYHTVLMFVQMYGRSIRHDKDKAITYILDSDFGRFYMTAKMYIPKHVRDAIVWSD